MEDQILTDNKTDINQKILRLSTEDQILTDDNKTSDMNVNFCDEKEKKETIPTKKRSFIRFKITFISNLIRDNSIIILVNSNNFHLTVSDVISEATFRFKNWHSVNITAFSLDSNIAITSSITSLLDDTNGIINLVLSETKESQDFREEKLKKEIKEKNDIEENIKQENEFKKAKISELESKGLCFSFYTASPQLDIPLQTEGAIIRNRGSLDKWVIARAVKRISAVDTIRFTFKIEVIDLPITTNRWKMVIGVIPINFNCYAQKHWVGSQGSWGYIAGNGGKVNNSGQFLYYGKPYGKDDVISVSVNFVNHTLEFFLNDVSQGIAFDNIYEDVYPAVCLTPSQAKVRLYIT